MVLLRLPEELHNLIRDAAHVNHVSVNKYICTVLNAYEAARAKAAGEADAK